VKFRNPIYQFGPRNFGTFYNQRNDPCLAPYWSVVDLDSFRIGRSRMSYYTIDNRAEDYTELFPMVSNYGKTLLGKNQYDTSWAVVISWQDLRPYLPGNFDGVSTLYDQSISLYF
jgi:hypothetical protein